MKSFLKYSPLSFSVVASMMAFAAHAETAFTATDNSVLEEIVVYGAGKSRQVQEVPASEVAKLIPGISPVKAIEKLPGVNFQSADPFGNYEWSTRITIRGFSQNQLGFTLDDIPLGDMSYGNDNGLHISRAIISENVDTIVVSQGAGDLSTASTSNLGGTLQYHSHTPGDKLGGSFGATYGSSSTKRLFGRIDSGILGAAGTKASLAYAYQNSDKWKGGGSQRQHQVNFKVVQPIGAAKLTGFVNYSDRRENDYQDMSLEMINRLGYNWDNFQPNWALAVQVAKIAGNRGDTGTGTYPGLGTVYPAPITSVDDAYYAGAGLRKDWLTGATLDAPITDRISAKVTGYYHHNSGQGLWFTPYVGTPGGAPISIRTTEYDISRGGVVSGLTGDFGAHKVSLGLWYENNDFSQARRFYGLDDAAAPSRSANSFQSNPFYTQWDFDYNTKTLQAYIQDNWSITDQFSVNAGFKGSRVTNHASPIVNAGRAAGDFKSQDWFIPQAGLLYKLNDDNQFFANYSQNMRAFVSAFTSGPFSTTQVGFDAIKNSLRPETSDTVEGGWRFKSREMGLQGVVAAYYTNFKNRLLSVSTGPGIVGSPSALQNVGGVKTKGFEAAATWQMKGPVSLFASYSYNASKYNDDVVDGNGNVTLLKGKTVVDTPQHMLKGELNYDDDNLFAKISINYMSKRFFTYTNDQSVAGRTLVDATLGYRFSGSPMLNGLVVQGNVTNLFDKKYVSTIGSNGFGNSGDNQTLLAGSPRQFFATLRKDF
jgi:iron complex outermembrane receptor protein